MKNLFLTLTALFVLSGCALTEFASDYLAEMVDVNKYERARDIDAELCDPDVLARLQKTHSKAWYDTLVKDCQSRKEVDVPLLN